VVIHLIISDVAMSSSQPWKLAQSINKSSVVCSVCKATRQLHLNDGRVHLHGPRDRRCLGSDKPLLDLLGFTSAPFAAPAPSGPAFRRSLYSLLGCILQSLLVLVQFIVGPVHLGPLRSWFDQVHP
jgi:hypothetical protein